MADFVKVALDDGSEVFFEAVESRPVKNYSGKPEEKELKAAKGRLEQVARAAQSVAASMREQMKPDELELEIAVGLSGDVGWFFAKSSANSALKVVVRWKAPEKG